MAVIQENLTLIHMNAEVGRKVSMYFKTADVAGLRIFYREDAICRRIRRLGDGQRFRLWFHREILSRYNCNGKPWQQPRTMTPPGRELPRPN